MQIYLINGRPATPQALGLSDATLSHQRSTFHASGGGGGRGCPMQLYLINGRPATPQAWRLSDTTLSHRRTTCHASGVGDVRCNFISSTDDLPCLRRGGCPMQLYHIEGRPATPQAAGLSDVTSSHQRKICHASGVEVVRCNFITSTNDLPRLRRGGCPIQLYLIYGRPHRLRRPGRSMHFIY